MKTATITLPKLTDCTFSISAEYEADTVRGNAIASGDDALDREVENAIIERLD